MLGVKKISHVCYETTDLERSLDYHSAILGLTDVGREDGKAFLTSTIDQHSVILQVGTAAKCSGLAFQIGPDEDLGEMARQVEASGVSVERESDAQPGVAELIAFHDPNGTRIEVFNPPPASSVRLKEQGIVPNKLGHVAFHSLDAERITDFYCDVLGFRVSDWLERRFSFLRCGRDHHTVNFIGSETIRHDHSAFELRDWSHIQQACDYLSRNNYRLIWGPGRHGIGHNLFIYHKNPDGLIVELYAELDTMSDEALGYFDPKPWHPDSPQFPKTWEMTPRLVNLWQEGFPPEEMLKV